MQRKVRVFHHPSLRDLYPVRRMMKNNPITCTYKAELEMALKCKIKINTTAMKMEKKIRRQLVKNTVKKVKKKMISNKKRSSKSCSRKMKMESSSLLISMGISY